MLLRRKIYPTLYALALTLASAREGNRQQMSIDLLDLWIPATGAEILNFSEGTLGLLGYVTEPWNNVRIHSHFLVSAHRCWEPRHNGSRLMGRSNRTPLDILDIFAEYIILCDVIMTQHGFPIVAPEDSADGGTPSGHPPSVRGRCWDIIL